MGLNSKPLPEVAGVQWLGRSPIGTKTAPKRLMGAAAVSDVRVSAGTIASSSGRASVVPRPFRTVRRDIDDLVMNMTPSSPLNQPYGASRARDFSDYLDARAADASAAGAAMRIR